PPPDAPEFEVAEAGGDYFPVAAPVASPVAPPPELPPLPVDSLVHELTLLRQDLQHFGQATQGHSAVQAEVQSLRSEIAALAEQRRIDALHSDVQRIAQRQEDLAGQLEEQRRPEPVPAPVVVEATPSADDDPSETPAIEIVAGETPDHWRVHLLEAEPAIVVRRLSELTGGNLVLSSQSSGPVSLSLADATPDEFLQAFVAALDCSLVDDGGVRLIVPAAQAAARRMATAQTVARLLRPAHMSAADLLPLMTPMLTPGLGEVAITPSGGDSTEDPRRAQGDALLVVDFPEVVAQVEAMLAEIDLPPEQFVIDAVITAVVWNQRTQGSVVSELCRDGTCAAPLRRDRHSGRQRSPQVAQFRGRPQALLDHLQDLGDVHIEATPSLQVLNRQLAEIEVGANIAYRESISFGRRMRLVEEEIDFLPSRTELSVRPYLQGGDTVRLQV
ncbi:MAG: hypothetical protein KDA75_22515, partial [Planctomycetaceae bacterium]|nr:hypothetical protein [Planctomycetaceae bacterium]